MKTESLIYGHRRNYTDKSHRVIEGCIYKVKVKKNGDIKLKFVDEVANEVVVGFNRPSYTAQITKEHQSIAKKVKKAIKKNIKAGRTN